MARNIKRYGSRKLYDTRESRYVSLDEIADWIRAGEDIQVIDNATSDNVTAQTLTQIISEEGRKRNDFLSNELLHDLIRAGGTAVSTKVKQIQSGVEGFVKKSIDRIVPPIGNMRDEMNTLRAKLEELEAALEEADTREREREQQALSQEKKPATTKKAPVKRAVRKSSAKSGSASTKTTAKKTATRKAPVKRAAKTATPRRKATTQAPETAKDN